MKLANLKRVAKAAIGGSLLPWVALAQGGGSVDALMRAIRTTLNYVIAILFVLITIYFIWGVIQYVTAGGDEEKLGRGKKHMLWGIIGLVVVGAAWGIAQIIWQYLGVTGGTIPTIPQF